MYRWTRHVYAVSLYVLGACSTPRPATEPEPPSHLRFQALPTQSLRTAPAQSSDAVEVPNAPQQSPTRANERDFEPQLFHAYSRPCLLAREGIRCWGASEIVLPGEFTQVIELDSGMALVLGREGRMQLLTVNGTLVAYDIPIAGRIVAFALDQARGARNQGCALMAADREIQCSINNQRIAGPFTQVSVARVDHASVVCGLREVGTVTCAALGGSGPTISPEGKFVRITGNCGLHEDGSTECWWGTSGVNATFANREFPRFKSIFQAVEGRICGVTLDGISGCWGEAPEPFTASEAYDALLIPRTDKFACGVRSGRVECWGDASAKGATPPEQLGTFRSDLGSKFFRCDKKKIDFGNLFLPPSKLALQGVQLENGVRRITVRKVDPNRNFFHKSEEGTQYHLGYPRWVDLGGGKEADVLLSLDIQTFNVFHGNSIPNPQPYALYAAQVDDQCQPKVVGSVDVSVNEVESIAGQRLLLTNTKTKHTRQWTISAGKLEMVAEGDASPEPSPPQCDPTASLARLPSARGSKASELIFSDACIKDRLDKILGKNKEKFELFSSFGWSKFTSSDGYLLADSCQIHSCGGHRAALAVNTKDGSVFAALIERKRKPQFLLGGQVAPESLRQLVSELQLAADED